MNGVPTGNCPFNIFVGGICCKWEIMLISLETFNCHLIVGHCSVTSDHYYMETSCYLHNGVAVSVFILP